MPVHSAGILLYRGPATGGAEVLLVHPGGPFFAGKDAGVWSIPKGEYEPGHEGALSAARREFAEESGADVAGDEYLDLGWIEQRKGKIVHAFAFDGDMDPATLVSNEFEMQWPPHSGETQRFPEVDRAAWFTFDEAREKILPPQAVFLDRLAALLEGGTVQNG